MLGYLVKSMGKIEWDKINYKSHFNNNKKQLKFNEAGNDLNLLLWDNIKNILTHGQ